MKTSDRVALLLARSRVEQTRALTRSIEGAVYYLKNGKTLDHAAEGEEQHLNQAETFIDEAQALLECSNDQD